MLRSTSDVGYYVIVMECLVVWTASESLYSTIPNVKPNDVSQVMNVVKNSVTPVTGNTMKLR